MKASAVLCSDIHLRDTIPRCRIDDYLHTQWYKLKFIEDIAIANKCPIICAGDFFNEARPSYSLLTTTIRAMDPKIDWFIIPGQHDLPNHNMKLLPSSGLGIIAIINGNWKVLGEYWFHSPSFSIAPFAYGTPIGLPKGPLSGRNIAVCHTLIYQKRELWPGCEGSSAKRIMKELKDVDLILCGDNHQSFVVDNGKQKLVNPGSMMRMTSDQVNHRPCIYLWYAEDNTIKRVDLPIEKDVFSTDKIDYKEEHEERINRFVEKLKEDLKAGFSFEKNMESFLKKNSISTRVTKRIWEMIGEAE